MFDQLEQEELLEAIELFYFSYRSFTAGPDEILQAQDLSRVHHRILYFVSRNPHISINELLKILKVSKQALNAPLRKLIELGMVLPKPAEHDRRIKQLTLSKKGKSLETKLTNTQLKHLDAAFKGSKNSSVKNWKELMKQISLTAPEHKK